MARWAKLQRSKWVLRCLPAIEVDLGTENHDFARMPLIRCGARRQNGLACRQWVPAGRLRCKFHGGLSTGPRTAEGKARVAQNIAGKGGTGSGPRLPKSKAGHGRTPKRVQDARRALAAAGPPSAADRLNHATDLALGRVGQVLAMDVPYRPEVLAADEGMMAVAKLQVRTATDVIALQVRVEEARLRATRPDALGELLQRIGEAEREREAPLPVIEVPDDPAK